MRPIFTTGTLAAVGQHHRHLQQHAEGVADDVGGEVGEALGAVPALKHERPPLGGERERRLQPPRLAGEDQRRKPRSRASTAASRSASG